MLHSLKHDTKHFCDLFQHSSACQGLLTTKTQGILLEYLPCTAFIYLFVQRQCLAFPGWQNPQSLASTGTRISATIGTDAWQNSGHCYRIHCKPQFTQGWLFPEPPHPGAPQFYLQPAMFVFAFRIIFSILSGTPGSLLQYSNPLHMQTSEWVIPCFWVWRKCTMKLQRLLLCKPWGEGFQVLMTGAPFLHRAPLFLSGKT